MDFKNVPNEFRPIPFWSWNDKLEVNETVRQIDEMEDKGIGGFFMHARGGLTTPYMGDEWFENVEASIKRAEEKGMNAWAYDENGWPSGFGNGFVNGKGVEYQQKYLRFEKGEAETECTIANVDGYHFYYEVNPFYTDNLDAKVVKCFIDTVYEEYYKRFGNRIKGFFTDEPQISRNGIPWSFILPDEYRMAYGENLLDVLPQLFLEVGDYKDTRIKFWKLVTELFSKNFMKQIYDWCSAHNLKLTGHLVLEEWFSAAITSNGACMPHYEYFTIPGMDFLGRGFCRNILAYQLSSVARQTGKKQVLSETFALCGHNVGHDELKAMYEHQMVRGVNLLCQHLQGYTNRGIRKRDYPPAMYIQQPWWKEYKTFNDAVSRIGMLLSEGDDNVSVLVIHPMTTVWTMYNDRYGFDDAEINKLNDDFVVLLESLERKHINFHLGDEIVIERHGKVEDNLFVIGEKKYSTVILPGTEEFLPNTERLLSEFESKGGTIVENIDCLEFNDVIDIPEITYCERHTDEYDMYYFVNSTENTYDAVIKRGTKIIDAATGEMLPFNGKHTFMKYESLIVIDDYTEREIPEEKTELKAIDLGGEWSVADSTENIITLDYCDYYFDGELQEKNGYILNAMYRALELKRPVKIRCEFSFMVDYIPDNIYLVCENPDVMNIAVNGCVIDKTDCGYIADKSFRKLNIAGSVKNGANRIVIDIDFRQSDIVYDNLEKSKKFESEKNKLTFDCELEQIYLAGDFAVKATGEFCELERNASRVNPGFVLTKPTSEITLENIERQGYLFFAGELKLKKSFESSGNMKLDFVKEGINVVKVKINGNELPPFLWEPFTADVTPYLKDGDNEIELTLVNNLRNMQGPFHLKNGEVYSVGPGDFFKEACVWNGCKANEGWSDDYCFVNMSIKNRQA